MVNICHCVKDAGLGGKQEAQLSQRDRAVLRVIEYFAKSFKVTRGRVFEYGVCKSIVTICLYIEPFFEIFSVE